MVAGGVVVAGGVTPVFGGWVVGGGVPVVAGGVLVAGGVDPGGDGRVPGSDPGPDSGSDPGNDPGSVPGANPGSNSEDSRRCRTPTTQLKPAGLQPTVVCEDNDCELSDGADLS